MSMTKCQENGLNVFKQFIMNPDQKEMVLSGSPGRGKSWLTQRLIQEAASISETMSILKGENNEFTYHPSATTGKAATVLGNMLGYDATTTHSLLGIRPKFNFKTKKSVLIKTGDYVAKPSALVIIDEASAIDPHFLELIRGATHQCKTLFIGDKRQLAAVGYSSCCVFDDPEVFVELKEPVRFDKDSGIAAVGAQLEKTIDTGIFEPIENRADVQYINGDEFQDLISAHYDYQSIKNDSVKIVAWSNSQVREYNHYVRSLFNESEELQTGERVICASAVIPEGKNSPVIGTEQHLVIEEISALTMYHEIPGNWVKLFGVPTLVFRPTDMNAAQYVINRMFKKDAYQAYLVKQALADLRPPFATTAYKAQGSSYDTVFVDLDDIGKCNCWSTVARMLNVAITRAKKQVYLYGQLPEKYRSKVHGN